MNLMKVEIATLGETIFLSLKSSIDYYFPSLYYVIYFVLISLKIFLQYLICLVDNISRYNHVYSHTVTCYAYNLWVISYETVGTLCTSLQFLSAAILTVFLTIISVSKSHE